MDHPLSHAAHTAGGEVAATPLARLAGRAVRSAAALRSLGLYAVLVLLVPGGSLIALVVGLHRRLRTARGPALMLRPPQRSPVPVLGGES